MLSPVGRTFGERGCKQREMKTGDQPREGWSPAIKILSIKTLNDQAAVFRNEARRSERDGLCSLATAFASI